MPPVTSQGGIISQLITTAHAIAAAGQQLHGSLSMDSMLDTALCLETTVQMTT